MALSSVHAMEVSTHLQHRCSVPDQRGNQVLCSHTGSEWEQKRRCSPGTLSSRGRHTHRTGLCSSAHGSTRTTGSTSFAMTLDRGASRPSERKGDHPAERQRPKDTMLTVQSASVQVPPVSDRMLAFTANMYAIWSAPQRRVSAPLDLANTAPRRLISLCDSQPSRFSALQNIMDCSSHTHREEGDGPRTHFLREGRPPLLEAEERADLCTMYDRERNTFCLQSQTLSRQHAATTQQGCTATCSRLRPSSARAVCARDSTHIAPLLFLLQPGPRSAPWTRQPHS